MSKVTVYVGLDYHKDSIQACVMDRSGQILANRRCPNQVEALVRLVAGLGDDVHAAVESCTGAAALADELAIRHGWSISLAHPGYVARMKQTPDKTDWGDARVLAD
jgi:transposase